LSLDPAKLQNVHVQGVKTIARCPACAENGMDEKGEHLVIQANGRFGCVVHPGAAGKAHRQRIFVLAALKSGRSHVIKVHRPGPVAMHTDAPLRKWDAWDGIFKPSRIAREEEMPEPNKKSNTHVRKGCQEASQASQIPPHAVPCIPPDFPDLLPVFHCLDYGHPTFREPLPGELILGIYRENDGEPCPILLWVDPKVDLFWDVGLRQHVKPPRFYIQIKCQPEIDPASGYPVIQGAVCPF